MPVVVVATMTAKPESVDAVRSACTEAIEAVHAEPGCELYALHEAGDTFVFIEQWADEEALKTHSTAPAIGALFGAVGELLDGAPDIKMLSRWSPATRPRASCAADGRQSARKDRVHHRRRTRPGPGARPQAGLRGRRHHRRRPVRANRVGPVSAGLPDDLDATVKLVEETGSRIVALQADVRDRDSLKTALLTGTAELGDRLDIVIANAGIAPMAADNAWQDVIDVNLTGVYHTVDVAMKPMIKFGNGGAIVLTSSVAAWSASAHRWRARSATPPPSTASSDSCGCTRMCWRSSAFGSTRYIPPGWTPR